MTDGTFVAGPEAMDQAGTFKATIGTLAGTARAKITRPLPWTEDFESLAENATPAGWISMAAGQFGVTTLDGKKVLQKKPLSTLFKRIRAFIGPTKIGRASCREKGKLSLGRG